MNFPKPNPENLAEPITARAYLAKVKLYEAYTGILVIMSQA